jgi:hypothetical protein
MLTVMLSLVRKYFTGRRRARQLSSVAAHASYLDGLHQRRFPETDRDRFRLLWCEIAEICGLSPGALREDLEIASLRSAPKSWLTFDDKLDDLDYLVLTESRDLPPPRPKPTTIGGVLDYLLQARQVEEIAATD